MSEQRSNARPRTLVLDVEDRLGEPDGGDAFRMNWEFWAQVDMAFDSTLGRTLTRTVTAEDAHALADLLEASAADESWQMHRYVWGDEGGQATGQFIQFLRGGGFDVVGPPSVRPGESP